MVEDINLNQHSSFMLQPIKINSNTIVSNLC